MKKIRTTFTLDSNDLAKLKQAVELKRAKITKDMHEKISLSSEMRLAINYYLKSILGVI